MKQIRIMAQVALAALMAGAAPPPSAGPPPSAAPVYTNYGATVYPNDLPNLPPIAGSSSSAGPSSAKPPPPAAAPPSIKPGDALYGAWGDPNDVPNPQSLAKDPDDDGSNWHVFPYERPAFTNGVPTDALLKFQDTLSDLAQDHPELKGIDRPLETSALNIRNRALAAEKQAYGSGGILNWLLSATGHLAAGWRDPYQVAMLAAAVFTDGGSLLGEGLVAKIAGHALMGTSVNTAISAAEYPAMARQAHEFGDKPINLVDYYKHAAIAGALLFGGIALIRYGFGALFGAVARVMKEARVMKQARMAAAASAEIPEPPEGLAPDVAGEQVRAAARH